MKKRKLGIIGGSGLYKMEGFEKSKWKKINTPWGKPSDEILLATFEKEEICFIPRHSRGHKINPTNIIFRANIDAMKQLGVTDIISVTPNCFIASIFALKLIFVGFILWPRECLGIKQISSFPMLAKRTSSEGFPHGVLIFFHLVFSKPSIL